MASRERSTLVDQEFGQELAGERVGWTAVVPYGSSERDIMSVNLVTATVGERGAVLEHDLIDGEVCRRSGGQHSDHNSARGFIAVRALTMIFDRDTARNADTQIHYSVAPEDSEDDSQWYVLRESAEGQAAQGLETKKVWSIGRPALIGALKNSMVEQGLEYYYPAVYYTANVSHAHGEYWQAIRSSKVPIQDVLLPDPAMHETTVSQLAVVEGVMEHLSISKGSAQLMMRRLTDLSDIPADKVPAAFEADQALAQEIEDALRAARRNVLSWEGVIRHDSDLIWPEGAAALREGKLDEARKILEARIADIDKRSSYTQQGHTILTALAEAEQST